MYVPCCFEKGDAGYGRTAGSRDKKKLKVGSNTAEQGESRPNFFAAKPGSLFELCPSLNAYTMVINGRD
jgi:hypothetical protein